MSHLTIQDSNHNERFHVHDDGRITNRNFDSTGLHLFDGEVRDSGGNSCYHFYNGEIRDNGYRTVGRVSGDTIRNNNGDIIGYLR